MGEPLEFPQPIVSHESRPSPRFPCFQWSVEVPPRKDGPLRGLLRLARDMSLSICLYIYVYVYVCVYMYMHLYVYMYMYVYIYIYVTICQYLYMDHCVCIFSKMSTCKTKNVIDV